MGETEVMKTGRRRRRQRAGRLMEEDDVTLAYRRRLQPAAAFRLSLISQLLVGEFPALPSAFCPRWPSPREDSVSLSV